MTRPRTETATILVVEDEADLRESLVWRLGQEGFATLVATGGAEALRLARVHRPDLVLLDLMLPDLSGNEVCRRLAGDPDTAGIPVVMLTARDAEVDRIVGFELGASDYVTKPFSPRELVLRIRAILRRTAQPPGDDRTVLVAGDITVDTEAFRVRVRGEDVPVTPRELRMLEALLRSEGRVLTRDALLDAVWPDGADVLERTVDSVVMRVRAKLGDAGNIIETVRGVGYRVRT